MDYKTKIVPEIQRAFSLLQEHQLLTRTQVMQELDKAMNTVVKKVSQAKPKNPLVDFARLAAVGRQASKAARERVLE